MNTVGLQPITRHAAITGNYTVPNVIVPTPVVPTQPRLSFEDAQKDAQKALLEHQETVRFNNEWNSYPDPKVSAMVPQVMLTTPPYVGMLNNTSNVGLSSNANAYSSPSKSVTTNTYSSPNEDVMEKQRMLNRQLGTNLKVDGIDGPKTQKAMGMLTARREADIQRLGAEEMASRTAQAPAIQQQAQQQAQPAQGGWGYNQEATDRMHQQWLNNELPEGAVPTAVYDGPPEGLAAKVAGWFK
jgi:hypothetical protein